jgi:hypothetical protein
MFKYKRCLDIEIQKTSMAGNRKLATYYFRVIGRFRVFRGCPTCLP